MPFKKALEITVFTIRTGKDRPELTVALVFTLFVSHLADLWYINRAAPCEMMLYAD